MELLTGGVSKLMRLFFREVFMVQEEMLVVPKLYVPIHTCLLRVVNNDTGEEIPRVFQKVAPHVYKKNKVKSILKLYNHSNDDQILCFLL